MAVDTAARRFSALNPAVPWGAGILPDGAIAASDRRALSKMYSGLAAGNAYSIEALSGSFAWTGSNAELSPTTNIDTAAERFAAMTPGLPWRGINVLPSGSIGRSQRQVIAGYYVPFETGPTYTITCESGSFGWTGEPSFSDFEVTANAGSFTWTGFDASLIATRIAYLSAGSFSWTGNDATLTHFTERTLVAVTASFAWTGYDAILTRPRTIVGDQGSFRMTGNAANLEWRDAKGALYGLDGLAGGFADFGTLRERKYKQKPEKIKKAKPVERETPVLEIPKSDPRLGLPKIPRHEASKLPDDIKAIDAREKKRKKVKELLLL
jgi:hypothetical protein